MDALIRHLWLVRTVSKRNKLTQTDVAVLCYVGFCQAQETRPACIQAALKMSLSQISKSMQRLEDRGFLARSPGKEDQRCRRVMLTGAGRGLYRSIERESEV